MENMHSHCVQKVSVTDKQSHPNTNVKMMDIFNFVTVHFYETQVCCQIAGAIECVGR